MTFGKQNETQGQLPKEKDSSKGERKAQLITRTGQRKRSIWFLKNQSTSFSLEFEISHTLRSSTPWGDPKKSNQRWKCSYHKETENRIENYRALKTFLDHLVRDGHLNELVDKEKTRANEVEVKAKPNPRFDRSNEE